MRSPWTLATRFLQNLKRWPWTRCAHCGLRLPFGYEPIRKPDAAGPRWFRGEPDAYHHACNTLRFVRVRLAGKTAALTEAYAIIGGLAAVLHSRLSPTPGVGPASRRQVKEQMARAYAWMVRNAREIDVVVRDGDDSADQVIKQVAAQYQREFQSQIAQAVKAAPSRQEA